LLICVKSVMQLCLIPTVLFSDWYDKYGRLDEAKKLYVETRRCIFFYLIL
jgi:hypothetical protein